MTPVEVAELKRLAESSTPGPWEVRKQDYEEFDHVIGVVGKRQWVACADEESREFIAAANPAAILALCQEWERMRDALENIAGPVPCRGDRGGDCAYCGCVAAMDIIERHEDDCPWVIARAALDASKAK